MGLIIDPVCFKNITHASKSDGGTTPAPNGLRSGTNQLNSPNDIGSAITKRAPNDYNEICVVNYDVIGVFVTPQVHFKDGESYSVSTICDIFSDRLRFFMLGQNTIEELVGNRKVSLAFNQIY
jgi:hypothetical protein